MIIIEKLPRTKKFIVFFFFFFIFEQQEEEQQKVMYTKRVSRYKTRAMVYIFIASRLVNVLCAF